MKPELYLIGNHSFFIHCKIPIFDISSLYTHPDYLSIGNVIDKVRLIWSKGEDSNANEFPKIRESLKKIIYRLKQDDEWKKCGVGRYNIVLVGRGLSFAEPIVLRPDKFITGESIITPRIISYFSLRLKSLYTKGYYICKKVEQNNYLPEKVLGRLCASLENWEDISFTGDPFFERIRGGITKMKDTSKFSTPKSKSWKQFGRSYVCLYISYHLGLLNDYIC